MTPEEKIAAMQRIVAALKQYRDGKSSPDGVGFNFGNALSDFGGGFCYVQIQRTPNSEDTIVVHLNSYMWDDVHPTYITILELLLL